MLLAKLGEAVIECCLPVLKGKYDDHPKRAKDLEQLLAIMERYSDLSLFLTDMALEPPNTSIGDTFSTDTSADNHAFHDPFGERVGMALRKKIRSIFEL